jgi:hypothetical protein
MTAAVSGGQTGKGEENIMFARNEGTLDRVLRVAVGLALLIWFFAAPGEGFWHWAKLIGVVPLVTGLIGSCPVYSLLGLSTCPVKRA